MKSYRIAFLSILMFGFAIAPPRVMAQVASAAALPSEVTAAVPPSVNPSDPTSLLAYRRPTEKEKWKLFEFDAFGPYALAKAVLGGAYQQYKNAPPEWGGGAKPFGERVASNFGIDLVSTTTQYGMAEILHEDAAYYPLRVQRFLPPLSPCGCFHCHGTPWRRWSYDLLHFRFSFAVRGHDDGARVVSAPLRRKGRFPNGQLQPGD
jgi:hypothetical protein